MVRAAVICQTPPPGAFGTPGCSDEISRPLEALN